MQNKIASAVSLAERAAALVDSVPYLYFLAQASQQLGDVTSARRFFERALDVARGTDSSVVPLDQWYWLNLQYAELLRQRFIPYTTSGQDEADRLKVQAIQHYEHALAAEAALTNASFAPDPHDHAATAIQHNRLHALNTVGVLLNELRRYREAVRYFERASECDATAVQPLGNLALALSSLGQQEAALRANQRALELDPEQPLVLHNVGLILQSLDRPDEALEYWERAHELNPNETETIGAIAGHYADIGDDESCLTYLRLAQNAAEAVLAIDPTRASAVAEVLSIRLRVANAKLPLVYQSVGEILDARMEYAADLRMLLNEATVYLQDPLETANIGCMGYYAVYQGFNDAGVRSQHAQIYRRGIPALSFTAPHVLHSRYKKHHYPLVSPATDRKDGVVVHSRRRIRVGFHSGFLRHHSVGLLMQGVITQLDRTKFEVVMIIYEESHQDDLTRRVLASADTVVLLQNSLSDAQQRIAALQLDVLVFTEIGMDPKAYFLAFARLALRTAVFWGHAVTSGIDTVDYFVSSSLFHVAKPSTGTGHDSGDQQQSKYVECVYEMSSLTTYFLPPPPSSVGLSDDGHDNFRRSLGLPPRRVLETMLLVPQTLYKLHPDFDALIERILLETPNSSFLVALTGAKPRLADKIRARWRRTLSSQVYKRVYFVRMLATQEFMDLCAVADVVLDPFPVGGGRSSLEIFSVGTPIVLLASRTTILQLTAAMYTIMGFDDLIAFTEDEYVSIATRLVLDPSLRAHYQQLILVNKAKLYECQNVISEWEQFLVAILGAEPPAERSEDDRVASRSHDQCPQFPVSRTRKTDLLSAEPLFEIRVTLAGHTDGDGPERNEFVLQLRTAEDDPFETITQFVARYPTEFDWLHQNLTAKLLWNGRQRLQQPVVGRFDVGADAVPVAPIEVRFGDDLHLMARAHLMKEFKRRGEVLSQQQLPLLDRLISDLKEWIPEHMSPEWIAARSFQLKNRVMTSESGISNSNITRDAKSSSKSCVTLVVTTCKRLPLFLRTIASLERALDISSETNIGGANSWSTWFCAILVIDDNSSEADRRAMVARVPSESFEFYFKSPEQRGHAKSLNLALARVRSRYLMYLEDDWEFRSSPVRPSRFLSDALAILQEHSASVQEPLALVLFNDQHGGWKRTLAVSESSTSGGAPQTSRELPYFVHEYASSDPAHEFAYWPGFSLNPGLWDLHAITHQLCESTPAADSTHLSYDSRNCLHHDQQQLFNEELDIFEHAFSLRVWRSGLRVAFLAEEHAVHIGAPTGSNSSAYVLNGMRRRFDAPATAA